MQWWTAVKVFSATTAVERNQLGERITAWLLTNPAVRVVDYDVRQSSDSGFHCISITLFVAK